MKDELFDVYVKRSSCLDLRSVLVVMGKSEMLCRVAERLDD